MAMPQYFAIMAPNRKGVKPPSEYMQGIDKFQTGVAPLTPPHPTCYLFRE
jgi:hypothetical protein